MAAQIWIDVEDLFIYGAAGHRPSGIQRLEFELCRAVITSFSRKVPQTLARLRPPGPTIDPAGRALYQAQGFNIP